MTLTLGSRSHKMLPSDIHIMWPMHLWTLKLLCPMVQKMHLQENTLFDLDPKVKVTWSVAKYPQHHVTYAKIHYLTYYLDLGVKVTRNVTQYPRHHVTVAQAIFEVATSKSLLGDAFTRKYILWPFKVKVTKNVTQYPLHHVIYASTEFEVATSNGLGEDTITRNVMDGRTDRQMHGRTTNWLWYEINIPYFSNEKAGIIRWSVWCHMSQGDLSEVIWVKEIFLSSYEPKWSVWCQVSQGDLSDVIWVKGIFLISFESRWSVWCHISGGDLYDVKLVEVLMLYMSWEDLSYVIWIEGICLMSYESRRSIWYHMSQGDMPVVIWV